MTKQKVYKIELPNYHFKGSRAADEWIVAEYERLLNKAPNNRSLFLERLRLSEVFERNEKDRLKYVRLPGEPTKLQKLLDSIKNNNG